MRTYSTAIQAEFEKEAYTFFWTLELQFTSTYYLTDASRPIYVDGNKYINDYGFTVSNVEYASSPSVDQMNVDIANASKAFSAILLGEDVRNKVCIFGVGVIHDNHTIIGREDLFRGFLADYEIDEDTAHLTIVNELILWNKKAKRVAQTTCPWTFKGTECGYAGMGLWCDQTYDRCSDLGNQDYFGGHRYMPSLAEKVFWWGKRG